MERDESLVIVLMTESRNEAIRLKAFLEIPDIPTVIKVSSSTAKLPDELRTAKPNLVLIALQKATDRGLENIRAIRTTWPAATLIVLLPTTDPQTVASITAAGADECLDSQQELWLRSTLKAHLINQHLQAELARQQAKFDDLSHKLNFYINNTSEGIWCFEAPEPIPLDLPTEEKVTRSFAAVCVECNSAYAAMFGVQRSDLLGKKLADLMPDNAVNRAYLTQFFENGGYIENAESLEYDPQGQPKHFLNSMYAEIAKGKLLRAWGRQIDLTQERLRVAEAENTLRRFRAVWESTLDGLAILDAKGTIVQANPAFCQLLGMSQAEVEGHRLQKFFRYTQPTQIDQQHQAFWTEQFKAYHQIHDLLLWNGNRIQVEVTSSALPVEDHRSLTLCIFHDVTTEQQKNLLLAEISQRYRWFFEYAPSGYHILKPDGTLTDVNTKWTQMMGYAKEEVVGKPIFNFVVPREREASQASFQRKINSHPKFTPPSERTFLSKDGKEIICLVHDYFTYDQDENLIQVLTTIQDITLRKQMEQEIRERERRMATLIDNVPGLVYRCRNDRDRTMEYLSPACEEITGYAPEELIDNKLLSFNDLIHPNHRERLWQKWQKLLVDQAVFEDEYPIITKSGEMRWVWERGRGVFDEQGQLLCLEGIITDITTLKKVEEDLVRERTLLRTIINLIPDAIYVKDTACRKTLSNIVDIHNLGGQSEADILGKDDYAFYPPAIADAFYQDDCQIIETGKPIINKEESIQFADGTTGTLLTSKVPLRDETGQIIGLVGIGHDISVRKQVEDALRESEAKFRALAESSPAAIYLYQKERFVYANPATERLTGYPIERLWQIKFWEVVHPDFRELVKERGLARQRGEPVPSHYEFKIVTLEGNERWIDFAGAATLFNGQPAAIGFAYDVTERKNFEEQLLKSKTEWETIFRAIGHPTLIIDPAHNIINANWSALQKLGMEINDLIGKKCYDFFHGPKGEPPAICPLSRVLVSNVDEVSEMYIESLKGWYLVACTPVFDEQGNLVKVIHIATDITERKLAEGALAESEEKLRLLVENMVEVFFQIDPKGKLSYINPAIRTVLGYSPEEIIGRDYRDFIQHEDKDPLAAELRNKAQGKQVFQLFDLHLIHKNGMAVNAEISAAPILSADSQFRGYVGVCRDVSEQRQLEQERARMAKLESLSILAGGIAHDFNNLLTGIMGNISLAKMKNKDTALESVLERAERASVRARDLTQQLLTFAKGGEPIKEDVPLPELVKESAEFVCRGKPVNLNYQISPNLPPAYADPGQISQVVQNLVINSVQAMPDGGTITIQIEPAVLEATNQLSLPAGNYLRLVVRDTGVGIPQKILSRVFDPYFSTKQSGSGLGLAIVHSIIKRHTGHIEVESEYGAGTTFTIYLPAGECAPREEQPAAAPGEFGGGKVLLMDDEELVLEVGRAMLESLGFEVETAPEGRTALEKYKAAKAAGQPFDAVIMDLTIAGGMGGKEAVSELKRFDPQAKAIVSSGYSNDPIMANPQRYGFDDVVDKPYDIDKLQQTLWRVLRHPQT